MNKFTRNPLTSKPASTCLRHFTSRVRTCFLNSINTAQPAAQNVLHEPGKVFNSYFLAWSLQVCNINDRNHLSILAPSETALNFEISSQNPSTNVYFTLKKSFHINRKFTKTSYTTTGSLCIRKHTKEVDYEIHVTCINIVPKRRLHEQPTALSKYPLYFAVAIATTNYKKGLYSVPVNL